ncbi:MAG: hypothetical protein WC408_01150 [Candidatus Micrarchaeia archaeon]|jgi:hypothetical protein
MGLIDWVGKKFKRSGSESKAETADSDLASNGSSHSRLLSIEELEGELALAKQCDLDVSERARGLLELVFGQSGELKQFVGKMDAANVGKDVEHGVIGETMRKQFVTRMNVLFESLKEPQMDYYSLVAYHRNLLAFLGSADRILRDNRYLLHFFEEEMKAFATSMRALETTASEFGTILASKSQVAQEYAALESLLEDAKSSDEVQAGHAKRVEECDARLQGFSGQINEDELARMRLEFDQSQKEHERLAVLQSNLHAKVTDAFGLLQKLLRKYGHSAQKKEKILAEKYLSDSVKAFFESSDGSECKALLSALRAYAQKNPDAKYPQAVFGFEANITGILDEHLLFENQRKKAGEGVRAAQEKIEKQLAKSAEKNQLSQELELRKARLEEEKCKQGEKIGEIADRAGKLLHKQVQIAV